MERKRGELVPIGEVFSDLGGSVKALREASLQARRGFTPLRLVLFGSLKAGVRDTEFMRNYIEQRRWCMNRCKRAR